MNKIEMGLMFSNKTMNIVMLLLLFSFVVYVIGKIKTKRWVDNLEKMSKFMENINFKNSAFPLFIKNNKGVFEQIGFCTGYMKDGERIVFIIPKEIRNDYVADTLFFKSKVKYVPIKEWESFSTEENGKEWLLEEGYELVKIHLDIRFKDLKRYLFEGEDLEDFRLDKYGKFVVKDSIKEKMKEELDLEEINCLGVYLRKVKDFF